jgi:mono/diheme cytochrome c family protein
MKKTIALLLSAVAVVGVAGAGCRGWESDQPPVHLNWNMDTQEKGKAYRASTFFADGRMMRTPPAGTVAQGYLKADDIRSEGIGADGTPTTTLPEGLAFDDEALQARGAQRYGIYCAPCHGANHDGKGPAAVGAGPSGAKLQVAPPAFTDQRLKEMPIGQIYQAIKNGVNQGNMGSYAGQIPEDDRWAIAMHVRKWQMGQDPSLTMGGKAIAPVSQDASPEQKGEALYTLKGCIACHSIDGSPRTGPTFKALFGRTEKTDKGDVVADDVYLTESMKQPGAKIVAGYPPAMPAVFGSPPAELTDDEIVNLIAYIKTLK